MFRFGNKKLPTESYKGVRDFFPEDQALQNYIFGIMRKSVESFGFEEYSASILESSELYKAKTSEEIVNEQTYSFVDRGGREVTLRPEMTPTVARMISGKYRDYPAPVRWYSIPNLFRYEKPQRGRLREHFQLNADIFGVAGVFADAEIISLASTLMKNFGAKDSDFEIRINSREFLNDFALSFGLQDSDKAKFYRLLDKKDKMSDSDFKSSLQDLLGKEKTEKLLEKFYYGEAILTMMPESNAAKYLNEVVDTLKSWNITNIKFSPTLTRGFDYYTGVVFEVFDTDKTNNRSLFGGGRYDKLSDNFIDESIPAVGFGMGDVTAKDFLETHGLLPERLMSLDLYFVVAPETDINKVYKIADKLRKENIKVAVDISGKKLPDQLKVIDKRNAKYVTVVGTKELESNKFVIRNTKTREESELSLEDIAERLR